MEQALSICQEKADGATIPALASKYKCGKSVIWLVLMGKTYPEVRAQFPIPTVSHTCIVCGTITEKAEWNTRRFCSNACSAVYQTKVKRKVRRTRTTTVLRTCVVCATNTTNAKYCSRSCQYRDKPDVGSYKSINAMRNYVLRHRPYICAVCGIAEWCGTPLTLQLDHIDGNATNNIMDNLRLICPNCHSQTSTYCGRNYGKGRAYRRKQSG